MAQNLLLVQTYKNWKNIEPSWTLTVRYKNHSIWSIDVNINETITLLWLLSIYSTLILWVSLYLILILVWLLLRLFLLLLGIYSTLILWVSLHLILIIVWLLLSLCLLLLVWILMFYIIRTYLVHNCWLACTHWSILYWSLRLAALTKILSTFRLIILLLLLLIYFYTLLQILRIKALLLVMIWSLIWETYKCYKSLNLI